MAAVLHANSSTEACSLGLQRVSCVKRNYTTVDSLTYDRYVRVPNLKTYFYKDPHGLCAWSTVGIFSPSGY